MKVLLTKDVQGLGKAGDVKQVSDGHARNFLIPKHLALPATQEVLARVQKEEKEHQLKVQRDQEKIMMLKTKLADKEFEIKAKASGSSLFAAVHERDIAKAINQKFPNSVEEDQVLVAKALKTLGQHEVLIKLNDQVNFKIRLNIISL
jgi:large subunit ribosomal protein L9